MSVIVLIRHLWADPARRNLVVLLWTAWFIYTVWFLNGPKNAWVRYYWYGLIWMTMLLGLIDGVQCMTGISMPGRHQLRSETFDSL